MKTLQQITLEKIKAMLVEVEHLNNNDRGEGVLTPAEVFHSNSAIRLLQHGVDAELHTIIHWRTGR